MSDPRDLRWFGSQLQFTFAYIDNTLAGKGLNSPSALVVGAWTHLTFTLFNGTMTMYINGSQVATRSDAPMSGVVLDTQFSIAALAGGSGNNINAEYDDFRIFDRALTSIQVNDIYNQQGVPGRADQVKTASAYAVSDLSPSPLTLSTYGSATSNTNSPFGGTEGSIENLNYGIPSSVSKTNFSFWGSNCFIEFWMYLSGTNSGNPRIIERGNYPNSEYSVYMNASSGGYYLKFSYGSNFPFAFQFVPGTWNHFSFSYNYVTQTLYGSINGSVASGGTTAGITYNSGSSVNLYPSGGGYVIDISNLRVVTGAATLPYISNFTVPTAPLSNYPTGTTALLLRAVSPGIRLTGAPLFNQLSPSATSSAVGAFSLRAVNGVSTRAVNVRNGTTSATQDFYADERGNLLTAPVVGTTLQNWLGGATGYVTTWYDQSGRGNHMSCSSIGLQPKIDTTNGWIDFKPSAYFDTSANPSAGPVPWDSTKNYTVVCHHNTIGSTYGGICETFSTDLQSCNEFYKTTTPYVSYWLNVDNEQAGGIYSVDNRVTFKWDGANRYIYINGSLQSTQFETSLWVQNSSGTQKIGYNSFFNQSMNGEMYNIFMFNSALSDVDRTLVENSY